MYTVTYQVLRVLDLPTSQAQNFSWAQSESLQFFMFLVAKQVSERVCAGACYLNLKWEVKESGCEHKTIVCLYPGTGSRTPSVDSLLVVKYDQSCH